MEVVEGKPTAEIMEENKKEEQPIVIEMKTNTIKGPASITMAQSCSLSEGKKKEKEEKKTDDIEDIVELAAIGVAAAAVTSQKDIDSTSCCGNCCHQFWCCDGGCCSNGCCSDGCCDGDGDGCDCDCDD